MADVVSLEYRIGDGGCWLWLGKLNNKGYGYWGAQLAHRRMYEQHRGPIPVGLELDHLCRTPRCVNPAHLEPVTHLENVRRGMVGEINRARMLARTHCKHGHEFTPENTSTAVGYRRCLTCSREAARRCYRTNLITCGDCAREMPHAAHGLCGTCIKRRAR